MKKISLLAIILLSCLLTACAKNENIAANTEPAWISKPSSLYPEKDYIVGLGYASTRMNAENAAYKALLNYIIQDISVQTNSSQNTQITASNMSQSQTIDQEMQVSSSISQIVGLGIKENYFDNIGTYYALAVVNKSEASSHYSDKIRKNILLIEEYREYAQKNAHTFASNKSYSQALELSKENTDFLAIMTTVDNNRRKLLEAQGIGYEKLVQEMKSDAQKISLALLVRQDERKSIENLVISALAQRGIEAQLAQSLANTDFLLDCTLSLSNLPDNRGNKFVQYTFTANLKDLKNNKNLNVISHSGRAGHATRAQAIERALADIEEYLAIEIFNF